MAGEEEGSDVQQTKPLLGSGKGGDARKEALRMLKKELPGNAVLKRIAKLFARRPFRRSPTVRPTTSDYICCPASMLNQMERV